MRIKGKITHWNREKGYGFITPSTGAKQVFLHITAFRSRELPPRVGQLCTFTLSEDKQGRSRAEDVTRDGEPGPRNLKVSRRSGRSGGEIEELLLIVLDGVFGYSKYQTFQSSIVQPERVAEPPRQVFQCDGRMHCSQMTSCAEARFCIQYCPNPKMDGDRDGVLCESQWFN